MTAGWIHEQRTPRPHPTGRRGQGERPRQGPLRDHGRHHGQRGDGGRGSPGPARIHAQGLFGVIGLVGYLGQFRLIELVVKPRLHLVGLQLIGLRFHLIGLQLIGLGLDRLIGFRLDRLELELVRLERFQLGL